MVTLTYDESINVIFVSGQDTTDITMQELIDDVRDWEDELENLDNDYIIDGSGKEELGGSISVGITLKLKNWRLGFDPRPGPDWVLCNVGGGNLVAVTGSDAGGWTYINPIYPTAYVSVTKTSSSSATLSTVELESLEYGGSIWVDPDAGVTGTEYPIGTAGQPSNNLIDARIIADNYSIETFHVHGDVVLEDEYSGWTFVAHSPADCTINLNGQYVKEAHFESIMLTGDCSGSISSDYCELNDITNLEGRQTEPVIATGFSIRNDAWTYLWGGQAVGSTMFDIDMNGGGRMGITKCTLVCKVKNMTTGTAEFLKHGQGLVYIDDSCTSGNVRLGGESSHYVSASTTTIFDDTTRWMVWEENIVNHTDPGTAGNAMQLSVYEGMIWIDVDGGSAGTEYPQGTPFQPVNNIADAKTIADAVGIKTFHCIGNFTLVDVFAGYTFKGDNYSKSTISLTGTSIAAAIFYGVSIAGTVNGFIHCERVNLGSMTNLQGLMIDCWITNTIRVQNLGLCLFRGTQTLSPFVINIYLGGSGMCGFAGDCTGLYRCRDMTGGLALFGAERGIELYGHSSCTAGTIRLGNLNVWHDEGIGPGVNFSQDPLVREWDELIVDHVIEGSFGVQFTEVIKKVLGLY